MGDRHEPVRAKHLLAATRGELDHQGRAFNFASHGATLKHLPSQVQKAIARTIKGLPKARILAVSEWGTLDSYIKAVQGYGLAARLTHAGKGPCSIFAPKSGKVVPEHVSYIRWTTDGYHAAFAAACAAVPTCRYDGGAARRIALRPADLAHRYEHLSVQGQAKLAAVEWRVLYGS
jgi:hypothetical protein